MKAYRKAEFIAVRVLISFIRMYFLGLGLSEYTYTWAMGENAFLVGLALIVYVEVRACVVRIIKIVKED